MNKEKIMKNGIKYYEEMENDILKQVSNIAYLCEGMYLENDKNYVFSSRVRELDYNEYTGKAFLNKASTWYAEGRTKDAEMIWRMETMVEAENDEYVQFVYLLYCEAMRYFINSDFNSRVDEHLSCMFQGDFGNKIYEHMQQTKKIQEIKREKRRKVCLMKIYYKYDDSRIEKIEKAISCMSEIELKWLIEVVPIRNMMTFMMLSNKACREQIYQSMMVNGKKGIDEIEDFCGYSFYLEKENIVEALDNLMLQLEKQNS